MSLQYECRQQTMVVPETLSPRDSIDDFHTKLRLLKYPKRLLLSLPHHKDLLLKYCNKEADSELTGLSYS